METLFDDNLFILNHNSTLMFDFSTSKSFQNGEIQPLILPPPKPQGDLSLIDFIIDSVIDCVA